MELNYNVFDFIFGNRYEKSPTQFLTQATAYCNKILLIAPGASVEKVRFILIFCKIKYFKIVFIALLVLKLTDTVVLML